MSQARLDRVSLFLKDCGYPVTCNGKLPCDKQSLYDALYYVVKLIDKEKYSSSEKETTDNLQLEIDAMQESVNTLTNIDKEAAELISIYERRLAARAALQRCLQKIKRHMRQTSR